MVGEVEEAGGLEGSGNLLGYLEAGRGVAVEEGAEVDELNAVNIICITERTVF